jgi:phosphoribosylamine--glycine ligase
VLRELRRRRIVYRGVLYAGVMITADGPKVLEFNCRFGDPETQAILPRFAGDLLPALAACVEGGLSDDLVAWRSDPCVCVVMASGGYPGHYPKGKLITGLPETDAEDAVVFHAGTATVDGRIVTAGGRVLGVTALGRDLHDAIRRAYVVTDGIRFEGAHFRRDIGARALVRLSGR